ncbi:Fe-S oxidoreductase [Oleiphilus messinensis]|uniref:Fe-S oxidoreductase n=2 Tax=Oleiphilus messinensis TaxID=141451 RepID=A0A1Y0I9G4_9GAMM|nr:Fe-S oxidoreductase [Oleiphilus messinensis]
MMNQCSAPWYELNLSAPQDRVSACCYYSGAFDQWSDPVETVEHLWNSPNMQRIRKIQASPPDNLTASGCQGCKFYENAVTESRSTYFDFNIQPANLSDAQRNNWHLAKQEFEQKKTVLSSTPLRIYANFGFFCNLTCNFCLQVPQRNRLKKEIIKSDDLFRWKPALAAALTFDVIGGEPFAQPEALKFIRQFCNDDDLSAVQLNLYTNGTLHHKHLAHLQNKQKLCFSISLDGVYDSHEKIRIGSQWKVIENNISQLLKIKQQHRPEWLVTTNSTLLLDNVKSLPDYAKWHVDNNIQTWFYDFINTAGNQDTYFSQNIISNPNLLSDIEYWEHYFTEAIDIFRKAHHVYAAETLEHGYQRIIRSLQEQESERKWIRSTRQRPPIQLISAQSQDEVREVLIPEDKNLITRFTFDRAAGLFHEMNEADAVLSDWVNLGDETKGKVAILLKAFWTRSPNPLDRCAHISVLDQNDQVIRGRRDHSKTDEGTELIMTAPLDQNLEAIRVSLTPTGEGKSYLPVRFSVELV